MNPHRPKILIADDEPLFLQTTGELLRKDGYDCLCVADAHAAREALSRQRFDLILSDLNMPGNVSLEFLRDGRAHWPDVPLIVVTGVPSLPTAVESLRLGITDYLLKPVSYRDLLASVRRALAKRQTEQQDSTRGGSDRPESDGPVSETRFPRIVGQSPRMREIFDLIDRVARTDANILITGESGTGKEIVAQTIHQHSHRAAHGFQIIDCTAIPESLFESILFGHARGAFTNAVRDEPGLIKPCDQGTVFFDEVGELPMILQAKLLRLVQDQSFTPVGKAESVQIDTRFICATNRDLEVEVSAGRFRRDLFYRLAVLHIELPPLRQRGDDVLLLAEHFLSRFRRSTQPRYTFSDEVLACFRRYCWPGNVRELGNVVERALALAAQPEIQITDLPPAMRSGSLTQASPSAVRPATSRNDALDQSERRYLIELLQQHRGNVSQASQEAGMSRQGFHKVLKKHGISAARYRK